MLPISLPLAYQALPAINWAGFYFCDGTALVLDPFQGKLACVRIALDRGAYRAAASQRRTQIVADVPSSPGHIPCDGASRSEIVCYSCTTGDCWGLGCL